ELNGPSSDFPPPPLVSILHPRISLPPPASPKRDRGGAKESWERSALYAQNPDFLEGARHLVDFVAETPEIVPGLQGILPSGLRRGAVPGAAAARVPEPALRPRRARRPAPAAAPAQPLRGPRRAHRRPGAGPQRHPERPGARDLLCAQHRAPAAGRGRPAGRRRGSRGRRLERRLGGAGAQGRGGRGRGGGGARPVREGAARLAEDGGGRRGGPDARRRRLEHGAAAPQPGGLERSFGPARAVHGLENGQGGGAARRDARHLSGGAVWWARRRRPRLRGCGARSLSLSLSLGPLAGTGTVWGCRAPRGGVHPRAASQSAAVRALWRQASSCHPSGGALKSARRVYRWARATVQRHSPGFLCTFAGEAARLPWRATSGGGSESNCPFCSSCFCPQHAGSGSKGLLPAVLRVLKLLFSSALSLPLSLGFALLLLSSYARGLHPQPSDFRLQFAARRAPVSF
ncbi:unnamed protein product, partial [Prorocentrum cordatum]